MPLSLCASVYLTGGDLISSEALRAGDKRDQGQQPQIWVCDKNISEPFQDLRE